MTVHSMSTYETTQPWVCYHYGLTHDLWWPPWSSTRVLGYAKIVCECAVCGQREIQKVKMPRFRKVVDRGHHPARTAFLARHAHPDRGHPWEWEKPMLNPAVQAFARRLGTEIRGHSDD